MRKSLSRFKSRCNSRIPMAIRESDMIRLRSAPYLRNANQYASADSRRTRQSIVLFVPPRNMLIVIGVLTAALLFSALAMAA